MTDAVIDRLEAQIPELQHRVSGAADFARLIASGKPPHAGVHAYVLPQGLIGGTASVVTGQFCQDIVRSVAVVLLTQSVDAAGARALDRLSGLIDDIITALAGWAQGDETGVYTLKRANILPTASGLLGYQIDFSIDDELRIPS